MIFIRLQLSKIKNYEFFYTVYKNRDVDRQEFYRNAILHRQNL